MIGTSVAGICMFCFGPSTDIFSEKELESSLILYVVASQVNSSAELYNPGERLLL